MTRFRRDVNVASENRTVTVPAVSSPKLTPYVPRLTIEWLRSSPESLAREIEGTMAFVDISGFTAMSERLAQKGKLGAEEVTEVMNRTFERLLDVAYGAGVVSYTHLTLPTNREV